LIKKKVRNDTPPDTNTTGAVRSAYVHSQLDNIQMSTSLSEALDTIEESSDEDFESNVKFDLLSDDVEHMFPDRDLFITYKTCSHSFVILADKSRTACLGTGTLQLFLGGNQLFFMTYYMFQVFAAHSYLLDASEDSKDVASLVITLDVS